MYAYIPTMVHRLTSPVALFMQQNVDPSKQLKEFACGMVGSKIFSEDVEEAQCAGSL